VDTYTITKLAIEALTTALLHGTLLFFMIRGFINPTFKWIYIFIPVLILLGLFAFSIYPLDIFQHPVFPLFQAFCFVSGILGAVKYYFQKRKQKKETHSQTKSFNIQGLACILGKYNRFSSSTYLHGYSGFGLS
jgi:hypothetical protein